MSRLKRNFNKKASSDAIISIYIDNLGMMNGGVHSVGRWVKLPMDEGDLQDLLEEVANAGLDRGYGDEWEVADVDSDISFSGKKYLNPLLLNELAQAIEDQSIDVDIAAAIVDACSSIEEAKDIIADGNYSVYHGCNDMEDVAREYIDGIGGIEHVNNFQYYIDHESFARDLMIDGQFDEDENGEEIEESQWEREDRYKELAYEFAEQDPEGTAKSYFDYEMFGRDMDIEGHFYEANGDYVEIHF